jgi:uncharacterized protein YndB with AHSA1/START domain
MTTSTKTLVHLYEVYIRTTPDRLWQALTDSDLTKKYFFGSTLQTDWRVGSPIAHLDPSGKTMLSGEIRALERPRKLAHTFKPTAKDASSAGDPPSLVTYEIPPLGEVCKLSVTHEHFAGETETSKGTQVGWPIVLSGLKTLLETNAPLAIEWPGDRSGGGPCSG